MKRLVLASVSLCALLTGLWAVSAAPTNFAGTWSLDKQKSEGLQGPMADIDVTMTVTQDDKTLTVETKYKGGDREIPAQKITYKLDGSETQADFGGMLPGKGTISGKWVSDGKQLELHTVRNVNIQGNEATVKVNETWDLKEAGKVLQVNRSLDFGQGQLESKLIFNKK
jgi:hypothetical protein